MTREAIYKPWWMFPLNQPFSFQHFINHQMTFMFISKNLWMLYTWALDTINTTHLSNYPLSCTLIPTIFTESQTFKIRPHSCLNFWTTFILCSIAPILARVRRSNLAYKWHTSSRIHPSNLISRTTPQWIKLWYPNFVFFIHQVEKIKLLL